jgi:hypothetical protein
MLSFAVDDRRDVKFREVKFRELLLIWNVKLTVPKEPPGSMS